jgi:hypothetical protein
MYELCLPISLTLADENSASSGKCRRKTKPSEMLELLPTTRRQPARTDERTTYALTLMSMDVNGENSGGWGTYRVLDVPPYRLETTRRSTLTVTASQPTPAMTDTVTITVSDTTSLERSCALRNHKRTSVGVGLSRWWFPISTTAAVAK